MAGKPKNEKPGKKLRELVASLRSLTNELAPTAKALELNNKATGKQELGGVILGSLSEDLGAAADAIVRVAHKLDPVRRPQAVFDPSNPGIVGRMIALTLTAQERVRFADIEPFYGSGIYAIYYNGDFEPYKRLVGTEHPIYVGKADPEDPHGGNAVEQAQKLFGRLNEHRNSIKKAENLKVEQFEVRYLVVASGWQAAAENYMIRLMEPIWNSEVQVAFGIGKHGDSAETRKNGRSPWDTLHPGRGWAKKIKFNQKEIPQILAEIDAHLGTKRIYASIDDIFQEFMKEMSQLRDVVDEPPPPNKPDEDAGTEGSSDSDSSAGTSATGSPIAP